ncbi:MAG: GNAT family N-acetyltransferase [Thaumarchaeota archaeon]|nr:GNAT family N-acetyltransferase [Nitrososphaerota archaeon]
MTQAPVEDMELVTVPKSERSQLEFILDESFEGLYLWHSRRTLHNIELVRALRSSGRFLGLSMVKMVAEGSGYVYYVAVPLQSRRKGLGGKLLDDALAHFDELHASEVFASVGEDNVESNALFSSRGFERTNRAEIAKRHGQIRTINMYREMMVVYGEILLRKELRPDVPTL